MGAGVSHKLRRITLAPLPVRLVLSGQALLALLACTGASTTEASRSFQPKFPIRAAFYYPWFPETWGHGASYPFTRYEPSLGYYASASRAVIRSHVEALRYGNVDAGIVSWWAGGNKGDARLPRILRVTRSLSSPLRWAVYYEPEGYGDPSVARVRADLSRIERRYGRDPAYLRIKARPVVFAYADGGDGCNMAERWRRANVRHGAYVVLKVFHAYQTCRAQPDSWHQYAPARPSDQQRGYSFSISPGFWLANESQPRLTRDPGRFASDVRRMVASREPWQLVTTFNEWGEGTAVESANQWAARSGYGLFLDALHRNGR